VKRWLLVLLVGTALLAACADEPASPPSAPAPTSTATATAARETATAPPATEPAATPTEASTEAATATPPATATGAATTAATQAPTPVATASPRPASTVTPAPTATATPTPTPGPACEMSRAPWSSFRQSAREEARDRVRQDDGTFVGRYTGVVRSQDGIQVDHIIPRNYACENGGHAWEEEQIREFLNDQDNLAVVASSENLRKGDSGPADYLPALDRCWYAARWQTLAERYGLELPARDQERLDEVLGEADCAGYVDSTATPEATATPATPATAASTSTSTTTTTTTTYASCDAAEDAGVERVQGSQGSGRGFPAAAVPSARDGDGDGVVCER